MSSQRPSFAKREREMKLKDKARAKAERRAARKAAGGLGDGPPDATDEMNGAANGAANGAPNGAPTATGAPIAAPTAAPTAAAARFAHRPGPRADSRTILRLQVTQVFARPFLADLRRPLVERVAGRWIEVRHQNSRAARMRQTPRAAAGESVKAATTRPGCL